MKIVNDYFLDILAAGALGFLRYDIFGVWGKMTNGRLWQQLGSGGMGGEAYLIGRSPPALAGACITGCPKGYTYREKCFAIIMWDG